MMTKLSSFCCGCSLKTGTIVIGVVQSVLSFTFMILTAAYVEYPHELLDLSDPSIIPSSATLKYLLLLISTASALQCAFSICLILGAEMNRPSLLVPWLIYNPISITVYVIGTIIGIVHHSGINNTYFILGHLTLGTVISITGAYKVMAVHSYYKHLKSLNF